MKKSQPTCLLIIPRHFYSFQQQFSKELENRGYVVTISNDEYPENIWGLLMGKLKVPLTKLITRKIIRKRYLQGQQYDIILIFKGRGLSRKLVAELKLHAAKVIGYNWDSFRFNSAPLKWYNKLSAYYTFDHQDSKEHNIPLVELFSGINKNNGAPKKIEYKYSAIFRNHSNRLKYLDHVIKNFQIRDNEILIYIFEQNIFFRIINFLTSPILYVKYKKYMHPKAMNYEEYSSAIKNSAYTIDYAHPKQTGITMRCFEALNAKTNIITNNRFIRESPFFKAVNPLIFDYNDSLEKLKKQTEDIQMNHEEWPSRTLKDFFNDILK